MRRTSVSLPIKQVARDPFEKPDRYGDGRRQVGILEKLKNDMMSQAQKTRWFKTGAILFIFVFAIYYLAPSGVDVYRASSGGQTPSDSSYGTDKCTHSYSKDKPIVQYVNMIDAGSTGSRIHVYKFNNCGATPELENEVFKMTKKVDGKSSGLSAYPDDPQAAAESLDILMEAALEAVPDRLKSCTPVAVKATAGLRLLGTEKSQRILDAVRTHLETKYPFPVVSADKDGVAIMDGSDEGVYAWITTNYLLGNIGGPDESNTAAVFDLGGGSTQIVFEPNYKGLTDGGLPSTLAEGDHKYDLDFGGRHFTLYQHSHLGYGLMSARDAIFTQLVNEVHEAHQTDRSWLTKPIVNPCFASGMSKVVSVKLGDDHPLGAARDFNFTGPAAGAPAQCRSLSEKILKKDAECKLAPCSFNGVHQPVIAKTFATKDIYFLSYFYDRTQPLGMPDSFTLREMQDLTAKVCGGEKAWDLFSSVPGALEDLRDRPEHCMDLSFMVALAHTGYDMPIDREVKIAKQIKNNELGWCLGASLPLLSQTSGWQCKLTEIH
ncbi:nucleoside phosphatase family-domain-containing protein [Coniella lustricola]|uniref:guanosine-diphosphatase n=1 Tax=Coniella lustricola TaxID=2025994 RepID=A0A2T3AL41_9PEZI|nr:nucleoside phosphatase family-domain-containing protein [Coniella lustricola]